MAQCAIDAINATEPYKVRKGRTSRAIHDLDIADKHHALLVALVMYADNSHGSEQPLDFSTRV